MPRGNIVSINDANIYYEVYGEGHPLILISGYACDHQIWLPILNKLKKHFKVILFDNQGVGLTTDNGKDLSIDLMSQDVISLMDKLNIERAHLIGHSMGGNIAANIAINYPTRLSKLILLTTSAKWRQATVQGMQSLLSLRQAGTDMETLVKAVMPWLFGEKFLSDERNVHAYIQSALSNSNPQSVINQSRQFNAVTNFDIRGELGKIKSETLVVYASEDLLSLPYESEFLSSNIPKGKLINLDCAHCVQIECPHELSKAILDFLKNTPN